MKRFWYSLFVSALILPLAFPSITSLQAADAPTGEITVVPPDSPITFSNELCLSINDGTCTPVAQTFGSFAAIVDLIIKVFTVGAIIFFMAVIFNSGYKLVFQNDKEKQLQSAKQNLTTGVIGLVVVAIAWWFVQIIGIITKTPDILGS